VLYASATVLLDLTANEQCIEQIAEQMHKRNMFPFVMSKLLEMIERHPSVNSEQKLRDLFIGIILNLTCNVENPDIIMFMIREANVIGALIKIMLD